jgi:peptidoglycan/LPS O-acetylase OafA/YrhL
MIHAIIGQIAFGLVSGPVATAPEAVRIAVVVMVLLTIVGCAVVMFVMLERPSRRVLRGAVERSLGGDADQLRKQAR